MWDDSQRRLIRFRCRTRITLSDGDVLEREMVQQKHPVSTLEVAAWLSDQDMVIERILGDHQGGTYTESSPRAIFWARRAGRRSNPR